VKPGNESTSHAALLEQFGVPPEAEKVWRLLLARPNIEPSDIASESELSPQAVEQAMQSLLSARLVQHGPTPTKLLAIDPTLAVESHIVSAERQLSEKLEALSALRAQLPGLADDFSRGRAAISDRPGVEIIVALEDIRRQIYLAAEGCRHEARHIYHSSSVEGFRDAAETDFNMMSRGVRSRAIVPGEELQDPDVYAEIITCQARGDLFRTLPLVPTRLIIYDRDLAVLRVDPNQLARGAIFVRLHSVIDLFIVMFDQMWTAADPVFTAAEGDPLAPTGRAARTLELMAIGTKDERIARALGVGARTIRRDISDLKATLGVSSRAEIVAAAIRRQWL
jgi:DNA-binding CsgD family transcriptional regulator